VDGNGVTSTERWVLAGAVVVIDLLLFALPLTGLFAAYVLIARPLWFREWVSELYRQA
jgi:hypothetical protein